MTKEEREELESMVESWTQFESVTQLFNHVQNTAVTLGLSCDEVLTAAIRSLHGHLTEAHHHGDAKAGFAALRKAIDEWEVDYEKSLRDVDRMRTIMRLLEGLPSDPGSPTPKKVVH